MRSIATDKAIKTVAWRSAAPGNRIPSAPTCFETSSKCCFLLNRFIQTKDGFYDAICSRSDFYYFNPSILEMHTFAASWLPPLAQPIHDYVGSMLNQVKPATFDLRIYDKLKRQMLANRDWKQHFVDIWCKEDVLSAVRRLELNGHFPDVQSKVAEFVRLGLGCPDTYFRKKKRLKEEGLLHPVPPIIVSGDSA